MTPWTHHAVLSYADASVTVVVDASEENPAEIQLEVESGVWLGLYHFTEADSVTVDMRNNENWRIDISDTSVVKAWYY